jgi:hypothetical protein
MEGNVGLAVYAALGAGPEHLGRAGGIRIPAGYYAPDKMGLAGRGLRALDRGKAKGRVGIWRRPTQRHPGPYVGAVMREAVKCDVFPCVGNAVLPGCTLPSAP